MAKAKTKFVCQKCAYESPRWLGRCPDCEGWNTLVEEIEVEKGGRFVAESPSPEPQSILKVTFDEEKRLSTGIGELDRILGGGVVSGSVILIGGDPGIGKSTLLLQACHQLSLKKNSVLYVSGEESLTQTKLRALRLGTSSAELYLVCEIDLEAIESHINKLKPTVVVIDSIQTVYRRELSSAPGSVSQVRESAGSLIYLAKRKGISIFLVGHVTKEGTIAGPRILEHMVDTVLYFEGEVQTDLRILRAAKNRFGSTNEIGIFEMGEGGLKEVPHPSELFLAERLSDISGSVVVPCLEGTRPLLVELQALVSPSGFSMPRRLVNGVDYNRACLLLAVLEKKGGLHLQSQDIFVSLAGGIRLSEPALDLGMALAVASSFRDILVPSRMVALGEVGLGGEIRAVSRVGIRIKEAVRLGFKQCLISRNNLKGLKLSHNIEFIGVSRIEEALKIINNK
ncbi:DNA repair protein RadA [candidate division NPL-UPA2 bacterium]|nr:DNA repair protein RadA [candidate division NPL-UPA2 bacterium]